MLTTITAIAGLVFGITAFIIGIINFRRDRPKLTITLEWDSVVVRDKKGTQGAFGRIYITNTGRRPIYITSAGIELLSRKTKGFVRKTTQGKPKGRKLAEGDPPMSLIVDSRASTVDILTSCREAWREFRAFAIDSTGKKYLSPRVKRKPSWGAGDGHIPPWASFPAYAIECDLEQQEFETLITSGDYLLLRSSEFRDLKAQAEKQGLDTSQLESVIEEAKHVVTVIRFPDHERTPDP